jgi:hypothetical protein
MVLDVYKYARETSNLTYSTVQDIIVPIDERVHF